MGAQYRRRSRSLVSTCQPATPARRHSPVSVIVVDNQGRRTVLWNRDPALDIGVPAIAPQVVASGRIFLADAYEPDAAAHAARWARDADIPTVLDIDAPGPGQEALSLTDVQFGPFVTRLKQLQATRRQT